jgi:hypothetical protein
MKDTILVTFSIGVVFGIFICLLIYCHSMERMKRRQMQQRRRV